MDFYVQLMGFVQRHENHRWILLALEIGWFSDCTDRHILQAVMVQWLQLYAINTVNIMSSESQC